MCVCPRSLVCVPFTSKMIRVAATYFICHVGQLKKAAKKLMWTYKLKYIYKNLNSNDKKLMNYLQ